MAMSAAVSNALGSFLKDRRGRLDPAAFGLPVSRRRTPGLRREEVAQRANISPTWYTWLEQGRGGAPSADVLNRIAGGLMLTEAERQHIFMLALGHAPDMRKTAFEGVSPRLQRLLDAFEVSPALIKTTTWDVVAWNRPAAAVLTDYAALPPAERNILRLIFCNPDIRAAQDNWDGMARFVVGAFRADAVRAGPQSDVSRLVDELCGKSAEFLTLWRDNDVLTHGEGTKRLRHPTLGRIELEYSSFAVDGRPDLGMIVYNPVTPKDADHIRTLMASRG
ncbi:helix-turn-helix transcriptional regulator [Devosia sp. 2618]|uniref:helix-turn-helix transcriptional regulator n=1 Tax=Devosia sp. 2618 TaxID=3156454 RepID=UPI0033948CD5